MYVEGVYGLEASNKLFYEMDQIIIHSLKSVQNVHRLVQNVTTNVLKIFSYFYFISTVFNVGYNQ